MFGDPEDWELKWNIASFGDVSSFVTSGSRGWAAYYADSGARFIRVQNLTGHQLNYEDIAFVRPPDTAEARRTRVEPNDLLLAITGNTIGLSAIAPTDIGEAYVSQHVAIIRLNHNVLRVSLQYSPRWRMEHSNKSVSFSMVRPSRGSLLHKCGPSVCRFPRFRCKKSFPVGGRDSRAGSRAGRQPRRLEDLFQSLLHGAFAGEL